MVKRRPGGRGRDPADGWAPERVSTDGKDASKPGDARGETRGDRCAGACDDA